MCRADVWIFWFWGCVRSRTRLKMVNARLLRSVELLGAFGDQQGSYLWATYLLNITEV
jgi:hypothetical protein